MSTSTPLRVLLVEDSEDDAALLLHELRRGGYEPQWERVDTAAALTAALQRQEWDVITCDWVMPQLSAPAALRLIQERGVDTPAIIVSGEVGEEVAVTAMKAGAVDYVSKHRLARLVPVVARELREAQVRRARRHAEEALRLAQERYALAIRGGYVAVWDWNIETGEFYVDASLKRALGFTDDEIPNTIVEWSGRIHPDDVEPARAALSAHFEGEAPAYEIEHRLLSKDGSVRWVLVRGTALRDASGRPYRIIGSNIDITDLKRAQEALDASERKYRTLVETAHDWIWAVDTQGLITFTTRAVKRILGYEPEECLGRPFTDFALAGEKTKHLRAFDGVKAGEGLFDYELELARKDGSLVIVTGNAVPIHDDQGGVIGTTGSAQDVTERRRTEQALRAYQERLHLAMQAAHMGAWNLDRATNRVSYSEELGPVFGLPPGASHPTYEAFLSAVHPDDRQRVTRAVSRALDEGADYGLEFRTVWPDGSIHWLANKGLVVRDAAGAAVGMAGVAMDVTDHKVAEEALRESEERLRVAHKLEAVGRLAGGVAHDFNNQLTVIKGSLQLLLGKLPADDPRRADAQRMQASVDRSAGLIRRLLTFSRREPLQTRSLNLSEVVNEMAPMLRLLLGEQFALRVETAAQLWPIRADRSQVEQVLLNLVANAKDAIAPADVPRAGATVMLETANVELDERTLHLYGGPAAPGPYVVLAVGDNGVGMAPEVREHIFEPFFTTKEVGKGTGLGLAAVFGIVRQHGGYIACTTAPGQGTIFRTYFPRDPHAAPAYTDPPRANHDHAHQFRATVLVVEDEASVRALMIEVLEESGYRVYGAERAQEALAVAERIAGRLDLLVTDVVMPGESGPSLARRLAEGNAALRVLFISGHLADTLDLAELAAARFLAKPFGPDELLRTVQEMLKGPL